MPLSREQAAALLNESKTRTGGGGGRTKADPSSTRELPVWWKLSHHIREEGCENPNCVDTRPKPDSGTTNGTNVVAKVKDKWMCRFCFLSGWLS